MYDVLVVIVDVYDMWVLYGFPLFDGLKWYICKCLSSLSFGFNQFQVLNMVESLYGWKNLLGLMW